MQKKYQKRKIRHTSNITQPTIDTDLISQSIYVLDNDDPVTGKNFIILCSLYVLQTSKNCLFIQLIFVFFQLAALFRTAKKKKKKEKNWS